MSRDFVDWVLFGTQIASTVAAAAAVWFAVVTNKNANEQAKRSHDALVRERRIDFELDVLKDLAEYNLLDDSVFGARARFVLLASTLPADLVPLSRAAVDLDSTTNAKDHVRAVRVNESSSSPRVLLRNRIQAEIVQAIARRVQERE